MASFLPAPPRDPLQPLNPRPMSPEEIAAGIGQEPVTDADLAFEQNQMGSRAPIPGLPAPPSPSPQPNSSPGLDTMPQGGNRSFLQKALPFLPAVAGLGMAALGKSDNLQAFGAGLAGGSVNSLVDQAMYNRDVQHQQSQHQLKNLDDLISKLRQLDDVSDPRQHHAQMVVQDYDNVLASGKLDGKQIQRLLAAANSVGPVESMVSEKQQRAQLSQYEAQKNIEDKLRRADEQSYNIGGQQVTLSPHDFANYQIAKERDRASMDRFLQAQANQDRRAGFGGGGMGGGSDLSPDMNRTLDDLVQKVTSGQLSSQNAVSMLGHGPSAYPLHRELALRIANAHLMIMPEKGRQRLQEIDTSLNYLNQAERLGEKVSQAKTPEEFVSAVDQYKSFIQGTTAVLPRAFGDRGNLAAVEGDRALSSLPNWERRALFPQHSREMISNLRNFINANRETVTKTYSTQYDETGGVVTGNSAAPRLPPPPGGSAGTTRKQGKDGNWYEKVNGQWHLAGQ